MGAVPTLSANRTNVASQIRDTTPPKTMPMMVLIHGLDVRGQAPDEHPIK